MAPNVGHVANVPHNFPGSPESLVAQARFWNVPNSLTVSRLFMALVVFACIGYGRYTVAAIAFGLAAITDALDGYFARLLKQETAIGRQLDPLVDKVIVAGSFIYLLTIKTDTGVSPWMVTAIVTRELIVQALRSLIEGRGEPFGARTAGKLKTIVQCLAILAVLLVLIAEPAPGWLWVRDGLIYAAVVLTLYSGAVYLVVAWPKLKSVN
jgi:CDP-diacylglycerol--glycerol-3-phosphate 3-phosphatidyltransferase